MAGEDAALAEPCPHRLMDDRLQPATVDRELRHIEAGLDAARLAPDLLAEAVGVDQFVGADGDIVEARQQPEAGQFLDRMRQGVDADPEFADLGSLLIDLAVDTAFGEHEGRGQATDTAADNDGLHGTLPDAKAKNRAGIMA